MNDAQSKKYIYYQNIDHQQGSNEIVGQLKIMGTKDSRTNLNQPPTRFFQDAGPKNGPIRIRKQHSEITDYSSRNNNNLPRGRPRFTISEGLITTSNFPSNSQDNV